MLVAVLIFLHQSKSPVYDPIDLVARYRAYRLPEPPIDATPVLCLDDQSFQIVGFRRPGSTEITYAWRLVGPNERVKVVPIDDRYAGLTRKIASDSRIWPTVALLAERGYLDLARRLADAAFRLPWFYEGPDATNPWRSMRVAAWGYWRRRAIEHPAERPMVQTFLRSMPKIDGIRFSPSEESFLVDLKETLASPRTKRSHTRYEAMFKQMLSAHGETLSDQKYGQWPTEEVHALAKPVLSLWDCGFDAVPDLFRHLDDRRITGLGEDWPDGNPSYHRVCDVAADLIEADLGVGPAFYECARREGEPRTDGLSAEQRIQRTKKLWNEWLAAKKTGELRFLLRQLARWDEDERGALDTVSTNGVRAFPLRILAVKYPRALRRFYRHVKFAQESAQIEDALNASKVPRADRN